MPCLHGASSGNSLPRFSRLRLLWDTYSTSHAHDIYTFQSVTFGPEVTQHNIKMLCSICETFFAGFALSVSDKDEYLHHPDYHSFYLAKHQGCLLCCQLWDTLYTSKSHEPQAIEMIVVVKTALIPSGPGNGFLMVLNFSDFEQTDHPGRFIGLGVCTKSGFREPQFLYWRGKTYVSRNETICVNMYLTDRIDNRPLAAFGGKSSAPQCRQLALQWMDDCARNHPNCGPAIPDFMPTRVIDIGQKGSRTIKLVNTTHGAYESYATLSYCWGTTNHSKLTAETSKDFFLGIDVSNLPRTFRNTVAFARDLGLRFLWVDSLCIYQDSRQDWKEQSALMGEVYKNGFINIAASASADSEGGLFFPRDAVFVQPLQVKSRFPPHDHKQTMQYFDVRLGSPYAAFIETAPLNQRGWVTQELMMAPRILHCASTQLLWECKEMVASESYPVGIKDGAVKLANIQKKTLWDMQKLGPTPGAIQPWHHNVWFDVIEKYTACKLTVDEDLFVALAGIAKEWGESTNGVYLAGLWRKNLELGLLWHPSERDFGSYEKRQSWRAPSWSWASLKGAVSWSQAFSLKKDVLRPQRRQFLLAQVIYAECSETEREHIVAFKGNVIIQGVLQPARIREVPLREEDRESTVSVDMPRAAVWLCDWVWFAFTREFGVSAGYELRLRIGEIDFDGVAFLDDKTDQPEFSDIFDYSVTVMPIAAYQEIRIDKLDTGKGASGRPYLCLEGLIIKPKDQEEFDITNTVRFERIGYFRVSRIETDLDTAMRTKLEGGIEDKPLPEVLSAFRGFEDLEEIVLV